MRPILIALLLAACGTESSTPGPDAGLPTCTQLGCENTGDGLCTREGVCQCHEDPCQRVGGSL